MRPRELQALERVRLIEETAMQLAEADTVEELETAWWRPFRSREGFSHTNEESVVLCGIYAERRKAIQTREYHDQ